MIINGSWLGVLPWRAGNLQWFRALGAKSGYQLAKVTGRPGKRKKSGSVGKESLMAMAHKKHGYLIYKIMWNQDIGRLIMFQCLIMRLKNMFLTRRAIRLAPARMIAKKTRPQRHERGEIRWIPMRKPRSPPQPPELAALLDWLRLPVRLVDPFVACVRCVLRSNKQCVSGSCSAKRKMWNCGTSLLPPLICEVLCSWRPKNHLMQHLNVYACRLRISTCSSHSLWAKRRRIPGRPFVSRGLIPAQKRCVGL